MTAERKVAVITDTGASVRQGSPEAEKLGITIVPLEIRFYENGQYVSYKDSDISPEEFYRRMRNSQKLPQTSGAVVGSMVETFKKLSSEKDSMISINITSRHSVAWGSALVAKDYVQEEAKEKTFIEVVDSKHVSYATWFLAEHAAKLADKGATLNQINSEVLELVPNIQLYTVLESFENLKKGGRADEMVKGVLASLLSIYPVIGFSDGKLRDFAKERSPQKARERMIEMVKDAGKKVKIVVVHTNAPELAEKVKESLSKSFRGEIPVHEAGPVLAVHAGERAVGVAFQKA